MEMDGRVITEESKTVYKKSELSLMIEATSVHFYSRLSVNCQLEKRQTPPVTTEKPAKIPKAIK